MADPRRSSFVARYLDPASHMGEILFGLIMTLTFTLAAGIVIQEEGREGAREMLIGILGCNLAWGIIDGVLYVLGQVFERGRIRRIGTTMRAAWSLRNSTKPSGRWPTNPRDAACTIPSSSACGAYQLQRIRCGART